MRNIFITLFIAAALLSCNDLKTEPIEKYGGGKYVIVDKGAWNSITELQLKNPDTIFWIKVLNFDAQKLNVGDTIK